MSSSRTAEIDGRNEMRPEAKPLVQSPPLSIPAELIQCTFLEAISLDPRPTCIIDLHDKGHSRRPVFWNLAFGQVPSFYNEVIAALDTASTTQTQWTSFTINTRWKVLCTGVSPPALSVTLASTRDSYKSPGDVVVTIPTTFQPLANVQQLQKGRQTNHVFPYTSGSALLTTDVNHTQTDSTSRIRGHGTFTDFFREFDWASTELGGIGRWPQQLVELCNLMLASPDPTAIYWGKKAVALYNEPCIATIGGRHPEAMGRRMGDMFPEVWEGHFKPLFDNIIAKGRPFLQYNDRRVGYSHGRLQEVFWNVTLVPVFCDKGEVVGTWGTLFDVTTQNFWQRRIATLLRLTASMNASESFDAMWRAVIGGFEPGDRDVPHLLVYTVSQPPATTSSLQPSSVCQLSSCFGYDSEVAPYKEFDVANPNNALALLFRQTLAADEPMYFDRANVDLSEEFWEAFRMTGPEEQCGAVVVVPIRPSQTKDVLAYLVVGLNPFVEYDQVYREFIDLARRQVSSTMTSILLRQEEVSRERWVAEETSRQTGIWKAEAELHELRFMRLAESAPIGICTYAVDGSMTFANDVWYNLFGMSKDDDFSGADWLDHLIHSEDLLKAKTMLGRLLLERQAVTFETRVKAQPGYAGTQSPEGYIWILASAYAEPMGDGPQTVVACFTDINEQKRAEDLQSRRLQDVVRAKRQQEAFIDMTSHEIRNPLSVVLQCSEEIISTCTDSRKETHERRTTVATQDLDNMLDAAETIEFCTLHQKHIVDDILTLSKLDSDLLPMTPDHAQPLPLINSIMKLFERELRKFDMQATITAHRTFHECQLDQVFLDPSRVSQIVINLVSNAIKFTKTQNIRRLDISLGGSIGNDRPSEDWPVTYMPRQQPPQETFGEYWTASQAAHLHFVVQDTGAGMSPEEQQMIFSRFTQASPRTHVKYGGSGLGLYICRALSETHGGQIGCTSTPGNGSAFGFQVEVGRYSQQLSRSLTTPKLVSEPATTAPDVDNIKNSLDASSAVTPTSIIAATMARKLSISEPQVFHILVVEDNILNQKVLRRQLEKAGHTVVLAQHGQDALDLLQKTRSWTEATDDHPAFDFIFMDIEMPVMNGLVCAQRIRENEKQGLMVGHMPIIATTGNARDENRGLALAAGMDQVVLKPFSLSVLLPIAQKLRQQYSRR